MWLISRRYPVDKVALCTIAFSEDPLEEVLDLASAVGFPAVELWGKDPHMGEPFDEKRVRGVSRMLAERGLALSVFGSYLELGVEGEIERAGPVLETAAALGAPIVRVWAGNTASAEASEEDWTVCLRDCERACRMAEPFGLVLAVEMHGGSLADMAGAALRVVEEVGAPDLKLNFQVSYPPEEEDPYERVRKVAPWVVNVHVQNFIRDDEGAWKWCLIEEGCVDYREILPPLKEAGFDGYFEVEFVKEPAESKRQFLEKDHAFLRSL